MQQHTGLKRYLKMGSKNSKPRDKLECGDWKVVEEQAPDKNKYLDLWISKYSFNGQLNVKGLTQLQGAIRQNCKNDEKKMKKHGWEETVAWIKIATQRYEGEIQLREKKENSGSVGEEVGATAPLYPTLDQLISPPAYTDLTPQPHLLKILGNIFSLTPKPMPQVSSEQVKQCLMIEVANPNAVDDNQLPTILVYRAWNQDDVRKASQSMSLHEEDTGEFTRQVQDLIGSYHLNGAEVQRVFMSSLDIDWHKIHCNWNLLGCDNRPLPHDSAELALRVQQLFEGIQKRFRQQADSTTLWRIKQEEDELWPDFRVRYEKAFCLHSGIVDDGRGPYQMHLKNGLHCASSERVRGWIEKHVVGYGHMQLDTYIDNAVHADRVTRKTETFWEDWEDSEIYYQGGRFRGRRRGGWNRPPGRGCWACGKETHIAKDCPNQKQQRCRRRKY